MFGLPLPTQPVDGVHQTAGEQPDIEPELSGPLIDALLIVGE